LQTAGIDFFRKGAFRKEYAAYRIQIQNSGWEFPKISEGGGIQSVVDKLIEQGFTGKALKYELENSVSKQICFASMLEQLPDTDNRIQPDYDHLDPFGIPKPKVSYRLDMYTKKALIESKKQMVEILKILKCTEIQSSEDYFGAGHIMGTYRMGLNSKSSVVNSNLQCHSHFNLFLLGSGVMPTAGTANPTLTIAALALRCADFVINNFRGLHAKT
jgi:choline dehydrogenase-like flavoprotein